MWLFTNGVAIYENGVAILNSTSRAPCRSQKYVGGDEERSSPERARGTETRSPDSEI